MKVMEPTQGSNSLTTPLKPRPIGSQNYVSNILRKGRRK